MVDTKLTVPSFSQLGAGGKPPTSALTPVTFSVDGVDLARLRLGPFASAKVSSGRSFTRTDADSNVAVVDSDYARANKLHVGSAVTIAHVPFRVIGIAKQPQGVGAANIYIPLARAQALAASPEVPNSSGKVDTIDVVAASASDIPTVQREIAKLLPHATVTSSNNLASEVTGTLADAASLIHDLGRWMTIAVLLTTFAIASLLTSAAVTRRVRELGTLKALGWQSKRIIAQILGESAVTGLVGAILGIALGLAATTLINHIAPTLTAIVAQNPGSASAQDISLAGGSVHHSIAPDAQHTLIVHMSAPVTITVIGLAVLLAITGALIAGSFGGWRAARLRPAEALRQVQ